MKPLTLTPTLTLTLTLTLSPPPHRGGDESTRVYTAAVLKLFAELQQAELEAQAAPEDEGLAAGTEGEGDEASAAGAGAAEAGGVEAEGGGVDDATAPGAGRRAERARQYEAARATLLASQSEAETEQPNRAELPGVAEPVKGEGADAQGKLEGDDSANGNVVMDAPANAEVADAEMDDAAVDDAVTTDGNGTA